MNNKTLLIIFVALLAAWGLSQMNSGKRNRSFKTDLIQIDTASITTINLYPKSDEQKEITLSKENGMWVATQGTVTTKANQSAIKALIGNLGLIKTKRIAAKKQEKWKDYEVEETSGSRVKVFAGSQLLEDFIVGRFSFNQQTRSGLSFVRLTNEDEVYAVDGFLSMTMSQGFDSYRVKEFIKLNTGDITSLTLTNNDGTVRQFSAINGQWTKEGNPIDSTTMATYLTGIQNTFGGNFVDGLEEGTLSSQLFKTLTIAGNNLVSSISVNCYRDINREKPYLMRSSQNKDAVFESGEDGIYEKVFTKLETL